jgi:hypothetical protein
MIFIIVFVYCNFSPFEKCQKRQLSQIIVKKFEIFLMNIKFMLTIKIFLKTKDKINNQNNDIFS